MKQKIDPWQLLGFGFVSLGGTLLHFLYDWTGSPLAALVSGVNESTWEHMKLLYFPMLIFAVAEYFIVGRNYENYWCTKLGGTLLGLALIPILFYTLRGVFGTTPDFVNIGIFFVAAALAFLWETRRFREGTPPAPASIWCLMGLCSLAVAFFVFTFLPPEIPLFLDPVSGGYGIT